MNFIFAAAVQKKAQAVAINDLVAAGTNYSLSIQNGRAWGWGSNSNGEVGDNTIVSKVTPVSVLGAIKTFCKISAGAGHSLAIDKNGRAWSWGLNGSGQLGDNSITARCTPVSVLGAVKTFCHIAASLGLHSMAIDKNGRLWGWGDNSNGRLGINSITSQRTPVSVLGAVKTFCKVAVGNAWTAAITNGGRVWCWGNGGDGRLGTGSTASALTPVSIIGAVKTFCEIAAGNATTAAIDKNGLIWSWGFNNSGQLGNGANVAQCTPVSLAGARKTFCKISLSNGQTIALDKNGGVWGWGFNANALLGDNSVTARNTPVSLAGTKKTFCAIAAGNQHSLAIDKYGNTWAWGTNTLGSLGANIPRVGNTPAVSTPKAIVLGVTRTFCAINTGGQFSNAIDKNGIIWSWGNNATGRLGDNSSTNRYTPINLLGATKTFCKLSAGGNWSLAIDKNGRVWAWGTGSNGRLGDNAITQRLTPVSILGAVKTFCQISAGGSHSLGIDKNGRAWGWGYNYYGGLGDNSNLDQSTPVSIAGAVKTFCKISADYSFSLAIDKNGRAWGWGYNAVGNLGDNSIINRWTPVSVLGAVKTFCEIAGGFAHSVAIDKNGRAWAWGSNDNGQLGDNSLTNRSTPVSVLGAVKTFCKISAYNFSTIAVDKNGRVWAWGQNEGGKLPIQPENLVVLTPIRVCGI